MSGSNPKYSPRRKIKTTADVNPKEIFLELDMDDSVKDIIDSRKNNSSTLLDVTVIRPSILSSHDKKFVTQTSTLNSSQVRKLIASMEMGNHDKDKLLDKIFCKKSNDTIVKISKHHTAATDSPTVADAGKVKMRFPSPLDKYFFSKKCKCVASIQDSDTKVTSTILNRTSSEFCISTRRFDGGDQRNTQQVYTTARSFKDMESVFSCKNKNMLYEEQKKNSESCNCKNCALMGLITDTQKKPLFAGPIEASGLEERTSRRRSTTSDHQICNIQYTRLTQRINELEERLATQEDRSVAKDYFKRIITKLVSHITKITSSTHNTKAHTSKHEKSKEKCYNHSERRYYVNPVLITKTVETSENESSCFAEKKICDSNTQSDDFSESEGVWRWGEEILRPGIDLKNKIMQLLEDRFLSSKRKNVSEQNVKDLKDFKTEKEIKIYVDVVSEHLYHRNLSNLMDNSVSIGDSLYSTDSTVYKRDKEQLNKVRKNHVEHQNKFVNIAYVNPKLNRWQDYSQNSIQTTLQNSKVDHIDHELCKERFQNILINTKSEGKKKLWNTIWNQATVNGQKKSDRVTIQIPNPKSSGKNEIVEIYYTIAELEALLNQSTRPCHDCQVGCRNCPH